MHSRFEIGETARDVYNRLHASFVECVLSYHYENSSSRSIRIHRHPYISHIYIEAHKTIGDFPDLDLFSFTYFYFDYRRNLPLRRQYLHHTKVFPFINIDSSTELSYKFKF